MMQYFSKQTPASLPQLKQLPNFANPHKITHITYPHQSISKLPSSLLSAHNVTHLDLSHNRLNRLGKIFHMHRLISLNISYNLITDVPKEICSLVCLELCDVSYNQICRVEGIKGLEQLWKIRKGNICIRLEGNEVMKEHGEAILSKFDTVTLQQNTTINLPQPTTQRQPASESSNKLSLFESYIQSSPQFQQLKDKSSLPTQESSTLLKSKNELVEFARKFSLLTESMEPTHELKEGFLKQSGDVAQYIKLYLDNIQSMSDAGIELDDAICRYEKLLLQSKKLESSIKQHHQQTLSSLSSNTEISMQFYKVWVYLYRKLRECTHSTMQTLSEQIELFLRQKQIQNMTNISPNKPIKKEQPIEILLFSENKESPSKLECPECYLKNTKLDQLQTQSKQQQNLIQKLTLELKNSKQQHQRTLNQKQTLQEDLLKRQNSIVSDLNQKIGASTYQSILLQQARGIQQMLKVNPKLKQQQKYGEMTPMSKFSHINSQKENKKMVMAISQFTPLENEQSKSKIPYFSRNEQSSRRSRPQTETAQTQRKSKKEVQKDEPKKHQISNSQKKNSQKSQNQKSQKSQSKKSQNKKSLKPTNHHTINPNSIQNSSNSCLRAETQNYVTTEFLISQPTIKEHHVQDEGFEEVSKIQIKQTEEEYESEKPQLEPYNPTTYKKIKLHDEDPYKNYVKYHLRNNIIETLTKKGRIGSAQKILSSNRYQTLITSRMGKQIIGESSRSSSRQNRSTSAKNASLLNTCRMSSKPPQTGKVITYNKLLQLAKSRKQV